MKQSIAKDVVDNEIYEGSILYHASLRGGRYLDKDFYRVKSFGPKGTTLGCYIFDKATQTFSKDLTYLKNFKQAVVIDEESFKNKYPNVML